MTSLPSAIIFVNSDLNDISKNKLSTQFKINETITDTEFDARVIADPNYPNNIHYQKLRILVIRSDFADLTNRELADIVLFIKQGIVSVEKNKYGGPKLSLPIDRIDIYALLRSVGSSQVMILPSTQSQTNLGCGCAPNNTGLGGIVTIQLADSSGVHDANCDNEYNNEAFINRK